MNSPYDKSCLGYHCELRDKCAMHKLPTQLHNQFFQPPETGESCRMYEPKEKWGWGKEKGFFLPSFDMIMPMAIVALTLVAALFFTLYRSTANEYAQFRANVEAQTEALRVESERVRVATEKINQDTASGWAAAVAVLKRNRGAIRVSADCNSSGLRPLPGPASGLNGTGAQLQTDSAGSITAEQCEAIANNAVIDAATLTYLQDWAKRQSEIKP